MSAQLLWDELLREVRQIVADALGDYRPNLARSTGVVPGNRLPGTGNTGSGYTPIAHAASHQDGGDDPLDLGSLAGELTDAQHGDRGGGSLHDAATTSTAGFATLAASGGTTAGTVVQATDARLSDARTPTAHHTSHQHGGSDEIATATPAANAIPKAGSGSTIADGWLSAAIARLTDIPTTLPPSGAAGGVLSGTYPNPGFAADMATQAELDAHAALTTSAHGGIVASSDSRLTDARTPTAHASSHQTGGSDALDLALLAGTLTDTQHGARAGGTLHAAVVAAGAAGFMSGADKTKLDGVASGATANVGTVTSVALTLPALFSVAGSPITTAGTLAATLATQAANLVFAGPSSGAAAAPTFRSLAAADIPTLDSAKIASGELPRSPLTTRGDLLTQNPSGTHTRLAIGAAGRYLRSDGTDPSWGQLDMADAAAGTLAVARGGTGLASYTVGDLLYASGTTALSKLADVATGNALISGGVGVAPAWGKIDLAAHISGLLPSANGGTGINNGSFTLTLPASGTAALIGTAQTFAAAQTFAGLVTLTKAGQVALDFRDTATGGTPSGGAWWRMFVDNVGGGGGSCTYGFYDVANSAVRFGLTDGGAMLVGRTSGLSGAGDFDANGNVRGASFRIGLNQVVGARATGWALPTGTLSRATFDQSTVTLAQLAQRVAALITDLYSQHGLIGA